MWLAKEKIILGKIRQAKMTVEYSCSSVEDKVKKQQVKGLCTARLKLVKGWQDLDSRR